MLIPVILSGGSGTRLWPLSRELYPKQFLSLVDKDTLLQSTVQRCDGDGIGAPIVVCNNEHRFMVAEQLRLMGRDHGSIVLEPVGRNTAPALAVAALSQDAETVLLVRPADHVIADVEPFRAALALGEEAAATGALVTFGIVPHTPETGYGYVRAERGRPLSFVLGASERSSKNKIQSPKHCEVFPVAEFVEKPDLATAERYVASGEYFWNSGMFMFKAGRYLEELERFAPKMLDACREALDKATTDLDFLRLDQKAFEACPSDSIDYAVMEKTDAAVVVPLDAGWSDIGSWSALWDVTAHDEQGNVRIGDTITQDVTNSYLRGETRLVAAVGVENQVIVETPDAVLVASKDRVQDVKEIVNQLKAQGRSEVSLHRQVHRPWGSYEGICESERFQVKRIVVNPGASLSLQMHHHRAEHWVVVKGTARIVRGDETFTLSEDQSTYIPLGTKHRLENPGKIPLELIEVQTGSYLGEDDIVRFDDNYGR
jgi:mannose-1-phosphate guanylyltransferase/mannose-6-phosphate isomerase